MSAVPYFIAGPVLLAWCKLRLWEWLASRTAEEHRRARASRAEREHRHRRASRKEQQ